MRPDWACELLSPSNAKRDLIDKFQVLHTTGVSHRWIADPLEQTLISVQAGEPLLGAVSTSNANAQRSDAGWVPSEVASTGGGSRAGRVECWVWR